jgi:DNA-binding LytR/AlgR family response regulator
MAKQSKFIRCLLVDDEPPALQVLHSHIAHVPFLEVVGECHHALAAFAMLQHQSVDLMFLDIKMPQMLGTDFLKSLRRPPKVIFTTAYKEYALDGYELDVVDYLLKPIPLERFLRAIQKLQPTIDPLAHDATVTDVQPSAERFMFFRVDRKMVKVLFQEILYVEGLKDYLKVHTDKGILVVKQTIGSLEEMLPHREFLRVHRSYIVAVNKISSYSPISVFIGKTELPIGRHYKNEVDKYFNMK